MRARFAGLVTAVLIAGTALHLLAQQPPRQTFRSARDVLTIDASVTGPGDVAITDLKAEDFTVKIDGQARPVLTVHRYGATTTSSGADALAVGRFVRAADTPPGRIVVIVVDRPSIKAGSERAAIESAAAVLKSLSPSDAVAAIGLPGGGVDLTRDHTAVASAIKAMTGMQPTPDWQHFMTWDEALGYEKEDRLTIAHVLERECPKVKPAPWEPPNECPPAIVTQSHEMLLQGRSQAQTTLTGLTDLLKKLSPLHAPKHMVVLSGGMVFDLDLLSRYQRLAEEAAASHVALSIVHLDQDLDASDRGHFGNVFGGREYATGLGTIASMTGGSFYMGAGKAAGAFDRIATSITDFYEIGVESRGSDADGKSHKVEVAVARPGASVRAPAATAIPKATTGPDALAAALDEPTDVAELPLEVATYTTHSLDPDKVGMIIAAQLPPSVATAPTDWGYVIIDNGKVIGGSKVHVDAGAASPWLASAKVDIAPGRYRLRAAVVSADGRVGTLDQPIRVGLRQAGSVYATDLVIGSVDGGRLQPRARVRQDEAAIGMIELSSSEPLGETGGEVQIIRGGTATPALRRPLKLRTRDDDKSIVVAEAALDLTTLEPGPYTASAVIQKGGAAIARVSRVFEIVPGEVHPAASAPPTASTPSPSAAAGGTALSRDPAIDELMHRVGDYVGRYGRDASVLIAVERYKQGSVDMGDQGALAGLRRPSGRGATAAPSGIAADAGGPRTADQQLISEIALVPNAAAIGGWLAYRDVIEVNGKAVPDRKNRLQELFKADVPDVEAEKKISAENARYNVGPVTRSFNVPMSALFFFDPAHVVRFTFQRSGAEKVGGVDAWKVDFEETRKPTMIMTAGGADVPTAGTLWIDPTDGSVLRTRLVIGSYRGARSRAEIDVSYRKDETLGMLIPVRMTELYLTSTASINGEATYSEFKRFQTSATVKVK
ncbi:MAG TPA: VWA domain-containing protein [Vicinamibacterales bacterium]|jgi:VWFA-related protein